MNTRATLTTTRSRAGLAGVAAVAAYLIAATISGRMSPLARRPLLDGNHAAVPYNWVTPPPEAAATNQPPQSIANQRVPLGPKGTGQTISSTGDQQLSLNLPEGTIPKAAGKTHAEISVGPVDSQTLGVPPDGVIFRGNAYRVAFRYVPGGTGVTKLGVPGSITMVFPAPTPELLGAKVDLFYSVDGQAWRKIDSNAQHATQQVTAKLADIGFFVVGAQDVPDKKKPAVPGEPFPWWVLVVAVVVVAGGSGMALTITRKRTEKRLKAERRERLARQSRSTKKR